MRFEGLRAHALAAALFAAVPAWMLRASVGPFLAPGLDGPALHAALLDVARMRSGTLDGWPEAPAATLLAAVLPLDLARAFGFVVASAVWLAGYGPWLLVRARAAAPPWVALLVGLCVQLSPPVLRGVPESDLLALGVGPFALGLAVPRIAWLCAAWGLPVAGGFAGAGLVAAVARRRGALRGREDAARGYLLAGVLLVGGLARPAPADDAGPIVPAYVAANGAVFPLPPSEAAPIREGAVAAGTGLWLPSGVVPTVRANRFAPPPASEAGGGGAVSGAAAAGPDGAHGAARAASGTERAEGAPFDPGGLLVPVQRLYVGPLVLIGLCVSLVAARSRVFGAAGLVVLAGVVAACGPQSVPGEAVRASQAGALGVAALAVALAVPGMADAFEWVGARGRVASVVCAALALVIGPVMENPRLVVPVTAVPPDPLVEALRALEPGPVLTVPSPSAPWRQGQVPAGRIALGLAVAGRSPPAPDDADAAATVLAVARRIGLPVDVGAGPLAWSVRARDPFAQGAGADATSWRYLVVDYGAVPALERARLDGWLADVVGVPIARAGERALYDRASARAARRER